MSINEILKLNQLLCKKEHDEYDSTIIPDWPFTEAGTKYFKKRIKEDGGCVFIALLNNEIVGYLAGFITKITYRSIKIGELENMFVLDKYRNSGIGTKLYNAFVGWCKQKGIKKVRVNVSAKNEKGIDFYRKNGLEEHDLILEADV